MFQLEEDYLEITMKNNQQYIPCASLLDEDQAMDNNHHVVRAQHQQHPLQSPFSISSSCSLFSSNNQAFVQVDHQAHLGDNNTIYPYQCTFTDAFNTHTFYQKKTHQPIFAESNNMVTNIPTVSSSVAAMSSTLVATDTNYSSFNPSSSSSNSTLCKTDYLLLIPEN
jgi:hypothetical protein